MIILNICKIDTFLFFVFDGKYVGRHILVQKCLSCKSKIEKNTYLFWSSSEVSVFCVAPSSDYMCRFVLLCIDLVFSSLLWPENVYFNSKNSYCANRKIEKIHTYWLSPVRLWSSVLLRLLMIFLVLFSYEYLKKRNQKYRN